MHYWPARSALVQRPSAICSATSPMKKPLRPSMRPGIWARDTSTLLRFMAPGCRKSGSVSNSLSNKRSEYILSTKVGRLILDEVEDASTPDLGEKGDIFKNGRPNK